MPRQKRLRRDARRTRLAIEPLEDRRLLAVTSFQDGVLPTPDYDGTRDAPLFAAQEDINFSDEVILRADARQGSTGEPVWSLFKWDLSSIPPGATVKEVNLTVNITNITVAPGFHLFEVKTPWLESEVTWNVSTTVTTWEEPGLIDPVDAGEVILGTLPGTALGPLTVSLTASGVDLVQRWVNNPSSNHGFLLASTDNTDSLRFDSREGATAESRPKLTVDFDFVDTEPPVATLTDPLDGSPADHDIDEGEVLVGKSGGFQIQLDDFAISDATVTVDTVAITKDDSAFGDFTFSFNAASDIVTLSPTGGLFASGRYQVSLNGGDAKISDEAGNLLPLTVFSIEIDEAVPTSPVARDDGYEINEDTTLSVDAVGGVLGDDDDGKNLVFSAVLVQPPRHGTIVLSEDGSFTYTPDAEYNGPDTFTYGIDTQRFDLITATVSIAIAPVPDAPVASDDLLATFPDQTFTVGVPGVLSNDFDGDGDLLSVVRVTGPDNGNVALAVDGSFVYMPNPGFLGTDSFTYRVADSTGRSDEATVTIAVLESFDFGDAPAPYATALAADGPYHNAIGPRLGATRDVEMDGQASSSADGDGTDDDGVTVGSIRVGQLDSTVTVDVQNAPNGAQLDAWIDFNGDGSWGGPFEKIAAGVSLVEGDNTISFDVPSWATSGTTFARFRLSTHGQFGPTGGAGDGEVEDYQITIDPPAAASGVFPGQNIISTDAQGNWSVFAADVDGDGDTDVLSASFADDKIAWYENDGRQNFTAHTISTTASDATSVFAADVDGDGDIDVLGASSLADKIMWYENDGREGFTAHVVSMAVNNPQSVFAADVDADGDIDVLSASFADNKIAWYENNGNQQFSAHTISTAFNRPLSVFAADVDGDGDIDVLSASRDDNTIAWHENDGSGRFLSRTISTTAVGATSVFATDVDGDGDTDVLSASNGDDKIAWYENDGSERFSAHTITTASDDARSVFAADMDGDGDIDVLSGSFADGKIAWYENLAPQPEAVDDEYDATEDTLLSVDAITGLLSNDFDPNAGSFTAVLATGPEDGTLELSPDGSFTYAPDADYNGPDTFTYRIETDLFSSSTATVLINIAPVPDAPVASDDIFGTLPDQVLSVGVSGVLANDFDGDGNSLSAVRVVGPNNGGVELASDGSFVYSPNPGFLGTDHFTYRAVDSTGRSDQATVTIAVSESLDFGDAPASYATTLAVNGAYHHAVGPRLGANRDVEADGQASLDADGDGTDEDGVTFGSFRVGHSDATVTVNVQNAPSGAKLDAWIDFNGDGSWGGPFERIANRVTVVEGDNAVSFDVPTWAAIGTTVARFRLSTVEQLGPTGGARDGEVEDHQVAISPPAAALGVFVGENAISTSAVGARSVFAVDMDSDGDIDVLSASARDNTIAWYENGGSGGFTFTPHLISTSAAGAYSVFAADVDGDGDIDVLSASFRDGKIVWYENDGSARFFRSETISNAADRAFSVFAADVDGDGDMDVLSASEGDNKIAWYENDGSAGFTAHTITNTADRAVSVFAADVDSDGDMDVLSASAGDNKIAWYENDGSAGFVTHTISTDARNAFSVFAADVDGDGDIDVLSASKVDDKIVWYENDNSENFTAHTISTATDGAHSVFAADVDGDGDVDVLSASRYDDMIAWHENDGSQNFALRIVNTPDPDTSHLNGTNGSADGARQVFAADVDGDGDIDVLSASYLDNKIAWYENVAIEAATEEYATREDRLLNVPASSGVLANDTSVDGGSLSAVLDANAEHGELILGADGSFSFLPEANFFGTDSFSYRARSVSQLSGTAIVTITVEPVNDVPVAVDDEYSVDAGTVLGVNAASGPLANDTDIEDVFLSATIDNGPAHGSLLFNADGAFTYTPLPAFNGFDFFTYRATDADGASDLARVSILVGDPVVDVRLSVVGTPSEADVLDARPTPLTEVLAGTSYFVEVWLQDVSLPGVGLASGSVDLSYSTAPADVVGLSHGQTFILLPSGSVDDAAGLVNDFGGGSFSPDIGVAPQWARLGYVEVLATGAGEVSFSLSRGALEFSRFGEGFVDWDRVNLSDTITIEQTGSTVRLEAAVVRTPSETDAGGEVEAVPGSAAYLHEWEGFWVEVWGSTPAGNDAGIAGATFDLVYNTDVATAKRIEFGPAFGASQSGAIDDVTGIVSNVGASTTRGDVGNDRPVLLARVLFEPTAADQAAVDAVGHRVGPYDLGLELTNVRTAATTTEIGPSPETELWAVIYDVDDSDAVNFGDFSFFAAAFERTVGDVEPPLVWWADFDKSGLVDFGDFSFFTANLLTDKNSGAVSFPNNFPEAWRPAEPAPDGSPKAAVAAAQALALAPPGGLEVRLVALESLSADDTASALPASLDAVSEAQTYFVEVWLHDNALGAPGITGGRVDLQYTTGEANVLAASSSDQYNVFSSSSVDEPAGLVRGLGGGTFEAGIASGDEWARLGYVQLTATGDGPIQFTISQGDLQLSRFGEGNLSWDEVSLGTLSLNTTLADLTNDGFVDADDLFVLLANWNTDGGAALGDLFDDPARPGINADDLFVLLAAWTGPAAVEAPQAAVGRSRLAATQETSTSSDSPSESFSESNSSRRGVNSGGVMLKHNLRAERRVAKRSRTAIANHPLRRLQAAAVDRAMMEEAPDVFARPAARRRRR